MTEYINKNDLIEFLENLKHTQQLGIEKTFTSITIDEAIKIVSKRPNADVIKRKDIDNIIEEMERHIGYNTDLKTGRVNILGQGQIMMLNILKNYLERRDKYDDNRRF